MMRKIACLFLLAVPAFAQTNDAQKPVAVINGETITAQKLDQLYDRIGEQMRAQYEKSGGKAAFLDNYVRKRLVVQEAIKSGFDKRPDVQADMEAAKESTLFDRYVRDVVASKIITDAVVRQYYDQHPQEFATPERVHVRHILITASNSGSNPHTKQQAFELIQRIAIQLRDDNNATHAINDPAAAARVRISQFAQLAKQYSEDASSQSGGDLGWVAKGQLDPEVDQIVWNLKVGVPTGIVETKFGYHIILVEDKQPAGVESFEHAKSGIREYLMTQDVPEVMTNITRLTDSLMSQGKVVVHPENIR
jgi:peptidyl-prolyl cis-trans isomerase C